MWLQSLHRTPKALIVTEYRRRNHHTSMINAACRGKRRTLAIMALCESSKTDICLPIPIYDIAMKAAPDML